MTSSMQFFFDETGRWSGGGEAFLNNARHAAERHSILSGSRSAEDMPIIARNIPAASQRRVTRYVLAPQNAWPWFPVSNGPREMALVGQLRVGSELYLRRASAVMRISSAIPPRKPEPFTSPVIHNVLDTGFEAALAESSELVVHVDGFISIGSGYSYRNLRSLISGYRLYREAGGRTPLLITGPPGGRHASRSVEHGATETEGLSIEWRSRSRAECLALMRGADAVVLPSLVEASPLSALEACAVNPRVLMSDIPGHREIFHRYGAPDHARAFFDPGIPSEIASSLMASTDQTVSGLHETLKSPSAREVYRKEWGTTLVNWLSLIAERLGAH